MVMVMEDEKTLKALELLFRIRSLREERFSEFLIALENPNEVSEKTTELPEITECLNKLFASIMYLALKNLTSWVKQEDHFFNKAARDFMDLIFGTDREFSTSEELIKYEETKLFLINSFQSAILEIVPKGVCCLYWIRDAVTTAEKLALEEGSFEEIDQDALTNLIYTKRQFLEQSAIIKSGLTPERIKAMVIDPVVIFLSPDDPDAQELKTLIASQLKSSEIEKTKSALDLFYSQEIKRIFPE